MEDAKRRGRPTVGERVPLGLRVTPEIKLRLDAAAAQSGRSQSQEAELRLGHSFEREDLLPEVLGEPYSPPMAGLLLALGLVMTHTGLREYWARSTDFGFNDHWINDPTAFDEALRGAFALLNYARPAGLPSKPVVSPPPGVQFANAMIDALEGEPSPLAGVGTIPALLGPIAQRMIEARARQSTAQPTEGEANLRPAQSGDVRDSQPRLVPILTVSQAVELAAFKWDPSRFADAKVISPRFACGPRAFALEVRNSDESHSLREGDILILDPDEPPMPTDSVFAQIDGHPKFADLLYDNNRGGEPVLITHDAEVHRHGSWSIHAVMTEFVTGRRAVRKASQSRLSESA
jgi:hypothetical protein